MMCGFLRDNVFIKEEISVGVRNKQKKMEKRSIIILE